MSGTGGSPFAKRARGHKYQATKADCGRGHAHPSKKEARRCAQLHLEQRSGLISELEIGPRYYFEVNGRLLIHDGGRRACYTPDFRYRKADGRLVVEDSKGMRVRDWPLRKALFRACYPDIEVVES
ncbi:DUF1064 domain-containing protein [Sphingomonas sp. CBMAI 2297]|uniref:DUF1064 domain-containing protein n=1 Tax=Sphingomonas sp. CBMAI 2297 TaxID=2991720 RepID=UPI002454EF00|nr:DUF1064 domain-containing protein [Sphingomonas sp. CBMAI 2297]MDH4746666.1 DUF1064 domain-containing protein [Sphingomonas sp. CBMAI 2297]